MFTTRKTRKEVSGVASPQGGNWPSGRLVARNPTPSLKKTIIKGASCFHAFQNPQTRASRETFLFQYCGGRHSLRVPARERAVGHGSLTRCRTISYGNLYIIPTTSFCQ